MLTQPEKQTDRMENRENSNDSIQDEIQIIRTVGSKTKQPSYANASNRLSQ